MLLSQLLQHLAHHRHVLQSHQLFKVQLANPSQPLHLQDQINHQLKVLQDLLPVQLAVHQDHLPHVQVLHLVQTKTKVHVQAHQTTVQSTSHHGNKVQIKDHQDPMVLVHPTMVHLVPTTVLKVLSITVLNKVLLAPTTVLKALSITVLLVLTAHHNKVHHVPTTVLKALSAVSHVLTTRHNKAHRVHSVASLVLRAQLLKVPPLAQVKVLPRLQLQRVQLPRAVLKSPSIAKVLMFQACSCHLNAVNTAVITTESQDGARWRKAHERLVILS